MIYAVLDRGHIAAYRTIVDWDNYPAHKKAARDELGDGGPTLRPVVYEGDGPTEAIHIEPHQVRVVRSLSRADLQSRINVERDRRTSRFRFGGIVYDYDALSSDRIDKARGSALAVIIARSGDPTLVGDLRWANPNIDFGWIAADNTFQPMDALTTLAFGNAAAAWEGLHIIAARALKDLSTIPEDYADDRHWPAG